MDAVSIFNEITQLTVNYKPLTFQLLKHDEFDNVYFGIDNNKKYVFVIESGNINLTPSYQQTRELIFGFNINCDMIIDNKTTNKTVHILTCLSDIDTDIIAFIRLTEAFIKSMKEDSETELNQLFSSLVNLFSSKQTKSETELQGLFAELYTIVYFNPTNIPIQNYWQSKDKMKFDFSVSSTKKIEVKSTLKDLRIHHFKHEQLLSDLYDIVVISYLLRKDDCGLSLFDLIERVRDIVSGNYNVIMYIERMIRNIHSSELKALKYNEQHLLSNLKFYKASDIPKFNEFQPDGVSSTEYDSDFSIAKSTNIEEIIAWIND